MKYIRIYFLIILVIIVASGCGDASAEKSKVMSAVSGESGKSTKQPTEINYNIGAKKGNSQGNIVNGGLAAIQGDWVYYRNENTSDEWLKSTLYRQNLVSGVKEKISSDAPFFINVVGDWVYYGNVTDGKDFDSGPIYRIKTDGTNRTKLNNDVSFELNVIGDFIYYINKNDDYKIYRMKTDGTEVTKLVDEKCRNLNVTKDWIYYTSNGSVFKVRPDGSGKALVFSGNVGLMIVDANWIYYFTGKNPVYDWCDGGDLYKIKPDGTESTKITDEIVFNFNIANGHIYYSVEETPRNIFLYEVDLNGNNKRKIAKATAGNIVGDWVYFNQYYAERSELERIRLDGTRHEKVSTGAPIVIK